MRAIFTIAKNEFRNLLYSPIAWFVLLVFFVQCAYFYSEAMYAAANIQDINLSNSPSFKGFRASLTKMIIIDGTFFPNILKNLYLFIPILTMGLISRDYNTGTHAILFSSPVSIRRIIAGKYLGIMLYNLLLVLVIVIFLVAGMFSIKQTDYGVLLSALLGFYLLICAYSAIGLYMSSLSNYQVVSAIGTFMVIFILGAIGTLWQRIDFVRDLTWFLSLQTRTGNMLKGLLVTKDIFYFMLVALLFIAFTYFRLSSRLEFRPWFVRAGRYMVVIAIVLVMGYLSSRPILTGYLDTTATQRNTIDPQTQATLKEFQDSTLEVTLYTNLLGDSKKYGMPENRNLDYLGKFWEKYLRFKPDIQLNYVYYYGNNPKKDDSALYKRHPRKSLEEIVQGYCHMIDAPPSMFMPESNIQPAVDLYSEGYRLVMQLKYQGRTTFLRTFSDGEIWPEEHHVVAALKRVLGYRMPSVAFSTGSLERSVYKSGERDYSKHSTAKGSRVSLLNIGYDTDTINLLTQEIPDTLSALVIADPKIELNAAVQEKINAYINKGGSLMINGEPGKQQVLNPILAPLGMQLEAGQIVYPSFDETPDKVVAAISDSGLALSEWIRYRYKKRRFGIDTFNILMAGAVPVISTGNTGWRVNSLANTAPDKSWLKSNKLVIDSILPPFNAAEGDLRRHSFATVQSMSRNINGKEQRIVITGDADFASNKRLARSYIFLSPLYSWLCNTPYPIFLAKADPQDTLLNIGERKAHYQKIVFIWVLPAVLLVAGTILLIRRKRK